MAAQKGKDAAVIAKATERRDAAVVAVQDAAAAEARTGREWNKERDAVEPNNARLFRASLLKCRCIEQLFDPWYMDANTRDAEPPEANMQLGSKNSNERLHAHHLHITVHEPNIL